MNLNDCSVIMIRIGDQVFAKATLFDQPPNNNWSRSIFGEYWETAKCYGIVQKIFPRVEKAIVKWDIDNKKTKIELRHLQLCTTDVVDTGKRFILF